MPIIHTFFSAFLALVMFIQPAMAEDILHAPLDDIDQIGLKIVSDRDVKAEGEASIRISTIWPTRVTLAEINNPDTEHTKLTYGAKVKTALGEQAHAYLEMWCVFDDREKYFSRGLDNPAMAESDWADLSTVFLLKPGQKPQKIIMNIVIEGEGTVWVDDVHLSRAPLN